MLTIADVNLLKCTMFHYTYTLLEIDWYGIKCNRSEIKEKAIKAKRYFWLYNTGCELPYELFCEIKSFLKNNGNNCVYTQTTCDRIVGSLDGSEGEGGGGA
jgi:hypothetical protein